MNREEAIQAVKEVTEMSLPWNDRHYEALQMAITALEEPEIIRCKDCKWGAQDEDGWWYCVEIGGHMGDSEKGDGFCSDAERRTE